MDNDQIIDKYARHAVDCKTYMQPGYCDCGWAEYATARDERKELNKMRRQIALITGVTGQDGSYLADHLLELGYKVYGLVRRSATPNHWRIQKALSNGLQLIDGNIMDQGSITRAIEISNPDEIYNLAAQSFVGTSWTEPVYAGECTGVGVTKVLEAIRLSGREIKFYQASSSEMFGDVLEMPQTETTRFNPRSPYGVAKVYGHYITKNYRESYNMHACSGILFNHESPRRGNEFVTRKITRAVARIKAGFDKELRLGNLDAKRDWGHAKDYVKAMHLMLQQDAPDDYVIATGETHTVREFVEMAFQYVGLDYEKYVVIDPKFFRPAEVEILLGDPSKAEKELGWEREVPFQELVSGMVNADIERLASGKHDE